MTSETDVERDMTGETVCGFRVAAWRETHPEHGDKFGHSYSEHWSTPSQNPDVKVERLFTETQLLAALSRAPEAEDRLADEKQEVVAALYKAWPDAEDIPSDWPLGIIGCIEQIIRERDEALAALSPPSTGGEGEAVAWSCRDLITGQVSLTDDREHAMLRAGHMDAWTVRPLYLHPSPEMGEISRDELKTILDDKIFLRSLSPSELEPGYTEGYGVFGLDNATDAILSKLKENGLSREELGGLARSLPSGDAQERCPVPPLSDGDVPPAWEAMAQKAADSLSAHLNAPDVAARLDQAIAEGFACGSAGAASTEGGR